jgi:hypothetical protein
MTEPKTDAAHRNTVEQLVGLDEWQAWLDSMPCREPRQMQMAIRTMIACDDMPVEQVREITTWSLAVERRKSNAEHHARPERSERT